MEAEAIVDLLVDDYPDVKFWVSFQCKVVNIYINWWLSLTTSHLHVIDDLTRKYLMSLAIADDGGGGEKVE